MSPSPNEADEKETVALCLVPANKKGADENPVGKKQRITCSMRPSPNEDDEKETVAPVYNRIKNPEST
ncbi:hypothetical protein CDAR_581211 [Caerostris darwini]|uniref:Uncharacterized protein n=1 Tax=Caerostris darwini TaxID=1538125 RepID=A0AAV4MLE7_9ARAC|nr:hypothetical protein CDAR_581211 [Caerostris darwini]